MSNMYDLNVKALDCDHDLAQSTTVGLKRYVHCVNDALFARKRRSLIDYLLPFANASVTAVTRNRNITRSIPLKRRKRDLLSALGIREDISSYVASSNRIIAENFDQISRH